VKDDITRGYQRKYEHLTYYWKGVKVALEEECEVMVSLKNEF
jgi:hypothetical protein